MLVAVSLLFTAVLLNSCTKSGARVVVRVEPLGLSPHPAAGTPFLMVKDDPNVVFSLVQLKTKYPDHESLLAAFGQALDTCTVARGTLDDKGSLVFEKLDPGSYWAVNPGPVRMYGARVVWSHPLSVDPQAGATELRLQRSNAALLLEE